jgi:hypothetical protein
MSDLSERVAALEAAVGALSPCRHCAFLSRDVDSCSCCAEGVCVTVEMRCRLHSLPHNLNVLSRRVRVAVRCPHTARTALRCPCLVCHDYHASHALHLAPSFVCVLTSTCPIGAFPVVRALCVRPGVGAGAAPGAASSELVEKVIMLSCVCVCLRCQGHLWCAVVSHCGVVVPVLTLVLARGSPACVRVSVRALVRLPMRCLAAYRGE